MSVPTPVLSAMEHVAENCLERMDCDSHVVGDIIDGLSDSIRLGMAIVDSPQDEKAKALQKLSALKVRAREMTEDITKKLQVVAEKLKEADRPKSSIVKDQIDASNQKMLESDIRSIFVGNVDHASTSKDLKKHFIRCGPITRVTILCDKSTGKPKGIAYIQFAVVDSVNLAMKLNGSLLRGRQIKVAPKRTNSPGVTTTNRAPQGHFTRGAGATDFIRGRGRLGFKPTRVSRPLRSTWFSPS